MVFGPLKKILGCGMFMTHSGVKKNVYLKIVALK